MCMLGQRDVFFSLDLNSQSVCFPDNVRKAFKVLVLNRKRINRQQWILKF